MFDETARNRARQELFEIVVGGTVNPGYAPPGALIEMLEIAAMELKGARVMAKPHQADTDILTSAQNGSRIGDWLLLKGKSLFHGGIRFARSVIPRGLPA